MDATAPLPQPQLAAPRSLKRLRTDTTLGERFCWGDEESFAVLYQRHRAGVLAVCMGVLGSRPDAEDAAQESFAALAVALRRSPPREIKPWLLRVARNAAIDLARRRRFTSEADDLLVDRASRDDGGSTELESVLVGLRELPESQRIALLMRELAGHSYEEIATLLEIDQNAVRGLIARARVGLRARRDAAELPCATARDALAAEPDGRRREKTVRRHLKDCPACRAYGEALRDDARVLRGLLPVSAAPLAGGGALLGGVAAKTTLLGGALTQVTAACTVSVCAIGGIALLSPTVGSPPSAHAPAPRHPTSQARDGSAGTGPRPLARAAAHAARAGQTPSLALARRSARTSPPTSTSARNQAVVSLPSVTGAGRYRVPRGHRGAPGPGPGAPASAPPPGSPPPPPASSPSIAAAGGSPSIPSHAPIAAGGVFGAWANLALGLGSATRSCGTGLTGSPWGSWRPSAGEGTPAVVGRDERPSAQADGHVGGCAGSDRPAQTPPAPPAQPAR